MLLSISSHSRIEAAQNCVMKNIVAPASDQANTVIHLFLGSAVFSSAFVACSARVGCLAYS